VDKPTLPWMKLYTYDWRADPAIRLCDFDGRGLCIDLMTLMHEAVPYGHLLINGRVPHFKQIAALLGAKNARQVEVLLAKLLDAGVFRKNDDGVVYSPRMIREHERVVEGRISANKRWKTDSPSNDRKGQPSGVPKSKPSAQTPDTRIQMPESSSSLRSDDGTETSDMLQAVADWNVFAAKTGLSSVQRLTKARKAKLRARLKECGGIEGWRTVLGKVGRIEWMQGSNPLDWRVSFDFVIEETKFARLMEGVHDRSAKGSSSDRGKRSNDFSDIIAEESTESPDRITL
jgi:hypothetical protein